MFAVEPFAQLSTTRKMIGQNLDRDDAIEANIAGAIHLTHPARTNSRQDFIWSEFGAGGETHFFNPAVQFCRSVIGELASSNAVLIRTRPSPDTSYWVPTVASAPPP